MTHSIELTAQASSNLRPITASLPVRAINVAPAASLVNEISEAYIKGLLPMISAIWLIHNALSCALESLIPPSVEGDAATQQLAPLVRTALSNLGVTWMTELMDANPRGFDLLLLEGEAVTLALYQPRFNAPCKTIS